MELSDLLPWVPYIGACAVVGVGLVVVVARALRRPAPVEPEPEPFTPLYPPFNPDEAEPEVVEGHVVVTDDLGDWEPTAHELMPPLIGDGLLVERAWPTLHKPPSWSAWTDAHPVVRLGDLAEFGAVA